MSHIKVEVLLPLRYKGKYPIEKVKFVEVYDELIERFNGYSVYSLAVTGSWKNPDTGSIHKDEENSGLFVICEDTDDNIEFFRNLKEKLKVEFQQDEIFMFYCRAETL